MAFSSTSTDNPTRGCGLGIAVDNLIDSFDNVTLNVYTNDVYGIIDNARNGMLVANDMPNGTLIQGTLSYFKISF